ncbi:DUF3306 domain-containing protein [Vibrio astriarenae]|uniref:DUF3306 domain-containing protein n=1 Tax=Vibrio astriarenae TaxID=1481923 RepID=A0A7Z2T7I7_9VIBR|nr:DUF3306 domain-containing protein [Vibrio astriarenae]QIA65666.1 DUF3306 domain-containing protein [Vibrio astriarenae]
MATSFISRWSKRKIEESQHDEDSATTGLETSEGDTVELEQSPLIDDEPQPAFEAVKEDESNLKEESDEPVEEMSVANLLVSEASESIKKAALRKLFLSEEFNVRDGLDDYDDDYSNLQTLSEGVAEKLRDWVNDTDDELEQETQDSQDPTDESSSEVESIERIESAQEDASNTLESDSECGLDAEDIEVRQNIPHEK